MKDELNEQMVKLREECANTVTELEKQLDSAHGNRMSSMFQMKEEVALEIFLSVDNQFQGMLLNILDTYQKQECKIELYCMLIRVQVELELGERMEQLRSMYKKEIDSQQQKLDDQKMSSEEIIQQLRASILNQKAEMEELNMYVSFLYTFGKHFEIFSHFDVQFPLEVKIFL